MYVDGDEERQVQRSLWRLVNGVAVVSEYGDG